MNELSTQDMLSLAAVVVLFMDAAAASVMRQRGQTQLAKIILAGGIATAFALLGIAHFAF